MKKYLVIAAFVAAFVACGNKGEDEPKQARTVVFCVSGFEVETEAMPVAGRRGEPILDDEGGTALTDLYVFDGTAQLAHQTSDAADFGTVTLNLSQGAHSLSFVATRSSGIVYAGGKMTFTSIRPTFGKLVPLTVSGSTAAQSVVLDRMTGQMIVTINDAFPADAAEIAFTITPKYEALDVATLCGTDGASKTVRVSCVEKVGISRQVYSLNLLAPSLAGEYTADVTITVYNAGGTAIHSVALTAVRMAANTRTMLSGNLFTGPKANVSVNHGWNTDIVGTF
jgi:hypothetical protein